MCQIAHVVGDGVQFEVQRRLVVALLIFLTTVLLVANDGFQITVSKVQRVVPHQFVVLHLLERQPLAVAVPTPSFFVLQLTSLCVALTLDDAGSQVEKCTCQS